LIYHYKNILHNNHNIHFMQYYNFKTEEEQFPLYYNFNLPPNATDKLKKYFVPSSKKFDSSLVFNTQTHENEYHEDIRVSSRNSIKDEESFELIEKEIMPLINMQCEKDQTIMQLVRDELELVKYETDGYFKKHQDFVNYVSNHLKCYACIICLEQPAQGGETNLYISDDDVKSMKESKTMGGCLIFRNEIIHEGCKIEQGEKVILKLNLWGFKKFDKLANLNDMIIVSFPNEKGFYVLHDWMYKKYDKSLFALHIKFNQVVLNKKNNNIVLTNITYEQFKPIYELLAFNKQLDYDKNKELLDYLGITNQQTKLIDEYTKFLTQKAEEKMDQLYDLLKTPGKLLDTIS